MENKIPRNNIIQIGMAFDLVTRINVIITPSSSKVQLLGGNTDKTISDSNIVGIEAFCDANSSETYSGASIITIADFKKCNIDIRYIGSQNLGLAIPLTRIQIGTIDSAYKPYVFNQDLKVDTSQSAINIASPLTATTNVYVGLLFYLRNVKSF
jgi:hypothetical protein